MKNIPNYDGRYSVSEDGRIHSNYGKGRWLSPGLRGKPNCKYQYVILCKDGKMFAHSVHRLVAEAYLDNPANLPAVDHIDGDRMNNSVNNLQWITHKDNAIKAFAKCYEFRSPDGEIFQITNLASFCSEKGLCRPHLVSVSTGRRLHHKGWTLP